MVFQQDEGSIVAIKRIVRAWKPGKPSGAYVTCPRAWAGEEVKIKLLGTREFVKTFVRASTAMTYASARKEWLGREVVISRLKYEDEKQVHSKFAKKFVEDRRKPIEESTTNPI